MTREEAIRKLEYSKKAYQMLIDEKVDSGKLVGKDVKGEWKADTPLDEAYKSMIDALDMAIKTLEQEPYKVSEYDKDHIWYRGVQYISLRRFLEAKSEEKNEPCGDAISRQAVLDKIRAEIMKLQTYKMFKGEDAVYVECEDVLQIIDKYKAEREETDANSN